MNNYTQAIIKVSSQQEIDILLAHLNDMGFEGFEEERTVLKAFIPVAVFDREVFHDFMTTTGFAYTLDTVEEQNWNAIWEAGFEPVIVDDFCAVRADFHEPVKGVRHEIIITPKMSFGTGHHATTYMMIRQIGKMDIAGKSVFDFGTGTGVLAILAEHCGALHVEAIDNDDWSIDNARENIHRNGSKIIHISKDDKIGDSGKYDIILANINRHVIVQQLVSMKAVLKDAGVILLSGLLVDDEKEIHQLAVSIGLFLRNKEVLHNWICLTYVNSEEV